MRTLLSVVFALVALAAFATAPSGANEAGNTGKCGKDRIWDADAGKCVPKKPRGSHAG